MIPPQWLPPFQICAATLIATALGCLLPAAALEAAHSGGHAAPGFSVVTLDAETLLRCQRHRSSSYDATGANADFVMVAPGQSIRIFDISGERGAVTRLWFTLRTDAPDYLREVRLSASFDGIRTIDRVPWGAFFATGPWRVNDVTSQWVSVMRSRAMDKDQKGTGFGSFNCHWPMPFGGSAVLEVENCTSLDLKLYYYVDAFTGPLVVERPLLLHVHHRPLELTVPAPAGRSAPDVTRNHVIADISGQEGLYAGTVLAVESHPDREGKWYEGDDRFVIDGQPAAGLFGTGTEDYFGMAWGVHRLYQAFDHGVTHYERRLTDRDRFFDGRFTLYRWHSADPIVFRTSLHASIEAGHANDCRQYYASTAFWYGRNLR